MPQVVFRPVMHIRADDPLFDVIEEDLRWKIESDDGLKRRVRFGGQNGNKYIDIIGGWNKNGILDPLPLIVENDGWPRDWEFSIEMWGDTLAVVYDRQGRIARPFFDGLVETKTGKTKRKRAYRLQPGCWVILISRRDGRIIRLKPYLFSANGRTGWDVESRIIGYTENAETFYRLFCSASAAEKQVQSGVRPYYATGSEKPVDQNQDVNDPENDPTDIGSMEDYYKTRSGQRALTRKLAQEVNR